MWQRPCNLPDAVAALLSLALLPTLSSFWRGFPRFLCFGGSAGGRRGDGEDGADRGSLLRTGKRWTL